MNSVSLIGCGDYGTQLALKLLELGFQVRGTTRSSEKCEALTKLGIEASILTIDSQPLPAVLNTPIIVLNIPPFEGQLNWLKSWNFKPHTKIVFISSTSVYGSSEGDLNESSLVHPDTVGANELVKEEEWVKSTFSSWSILRFGGLISTQKRPARFLSGKKNLKGQNWPVNLVHMDDAVGMTLKIIENIDHNHLLNVVSDEHSSRKDFYTEQCRLGNLQVPEFDESDLTPGKKILNHKAKELYTFLHPTLIGKAL